ncbi:MAG: alcohol dehydrogenase catalytic domain-containing protein [Candidatus Sumerlaeota bacterium]|nr:alcohol dehydrogenase catalytic domain-containing protein [Candidatus Sumerlaeota bacterium]
MKKMVLMGIRQMEMRRAPEPKIERDTDVLIQMKRVGVCGSDVHYYTTGRIGSQVAHYPFAVGHEGAGVVEQVGAAVERVKPGDHIAIEPAMSCWQCDQCQSGRPHTCRKLRFLGCPGQAEGCLAEYIIMPQECCFAIRDEMTLDQAALSEPLAIGVYAVKRSIPMQGAKVGILGAGPIGMSVMLPALHEGAAAVYVTDKIPERLELARRMGAAWAGNPAEEDVIAAVAECEPLQLDVVFECCGQQDALDQAVKLVKPGGKLMVVGIPEVDRVSFGIDDMRRKELCIQNVRRQVHCVQAALDLIDSGAIVVDPFITHRFSFDQTKEAFDLVADYRDGVLKAMIEF